MLAGLMMLFLQIQELNGKKFENPQTANLHKILEDSISITELLKERNNNSTEGNTAGETDNTVRNQMLSVQLSFLFSYNLINCVLIFSIFSFWSFVLQCVCNCLGITLHACIFCTTDVKVR